jgi:hypothetical protein
MLQYFDPSFYRLPAVWGEDADMWRPQRFLEETDISEKTAVGAYANLYWLSDNDGLFCAAN